MKIGSIWAELKFNLVHPTASMIAAIEGVQLDFY